MLESFGEPRGGLLAVGCYTFLAPLRAGVCVLLVAVATPALAGERVAGLKRDASAWLDRDAAVLEQSNQRIWSHAETSLQEFESSRELQRLLRSAGFRIESGVANMPTAFVAKFGQGRPVIGLLAEFDALKGVSQGNTAMPSPGPNRSAGHACGHSIFGVGSVAAALALKRLITDGRLEGTIKLYGTPAEETLIGKVYMLRAGLFKDDDVILHWHANDVTEADYRTSKALLNVKFRFTGTAAHASEQPFAGRSALDAVELMNVGVNYLREHLKSDARIHYAITRGGDLPNVVPAQAESWYYIRANSFADAREHFARIREIAAGAAQMTRTEWSVVIESEAHELLPVRTLAQVIHRNLEAVGPPAWSASELAFARETQRNFKDVTGRDYSAQPLSLATTIEPLASEPVQGTGSTDVADISWFVPVGGFQVSAYGYGLPIHSWPVVAATGTSIGTKALITAAKTLAGTAIDLYTDPELLERIKVEWRAQRSVMPAWSTAIPENQTVPNLEGR